ncbi:MAG TPA: glycosyltransferase, partial [Candidatus Limnocylindria bacterium]|nr:glycosyltransferase [Candidatus Limnocylindria bacterium]
PPQKGGPDVTRAAYHLAVALAGLLAHLYLFRRFPRLPAAKGPMPVIPPVSVVIPARDEEHNLPGLLADLRAQTLSPLEVIVADDDSGDATADVARQGGATILSLHGKPEGWTGKTWACQNGADAAKGGLLLFLDADVRLGPDALRRLAQAYAASRRAVSVQPYHVTEKAYEQLSLMFNLIVPASIGATRPGTPQRGLFGPVLLVPRGLYDKAGGHAGVRGHIVEDMELGIRLAGAGTPGSLLFGDAGLTYRMYGGGLRSLFQGWAKNMAAGASGTPPLTLLAVVLWVASACSVPVRLARHMATGDLPWLAVYLALYAAWAAALAWAGRRIGRFSPWAYALFPVPLAAFVAIFLVSSVRRLLRLPVTWKGREIREERPR